MGRSLADYQLEHDIAMQDDRDSRERFDPLTCQCCGFKRHRPDEPDCVCDGLDWYHLPNGDIECVAHRFERHMGRKKKSLLTFWKR